MEQEKEECWRREKISEEVVDINNSRIRSGMKDRKVELEPEMDCV